MWELLRKSINGVINKVNEYINKLGEYHKYSEYNS